MRAVELFPFYNNFNPADPGYTQLKDYVEGVKKLLTSGYFYFSYNFDLTSSRQRSGLMRSQSLGGHQSVWETCDTRYFWNYNICQDLYYHKVDTKWIVPVIQGYVEQKSSMFDGKKLDMVLISRRRHG